MANPNFEYLYSCSTGEQGITALFSAVRAHAMKRLRGYPRLRNQWEDVAQDVTIAVFRGLAVGQYKATSPLINWINRILTNHLNDELRASATRGIVEVSLDLDDHAHDGRRGDTSYPNLNVIDDAALKEVAALLLLGYSIDESADRLNITSVALRKRLQRYRASPSFPSTRIGPRGQTRQVPETVRARD